VVEGGGEGAEYGSESPIGSVVLRGGSQVKKGERNSTSEKKICTNTPFFPLGGDCHFLSIKKIKRQLKGKDSIVSLHH